MHAATTEWSSQLKSKTQWNRKQPLLALAAVSEGKGILTVGLGK